MTQNKARKAPTQEQLADLAAQTLLILIALVLMLGSAIGYAVTENKLFLAATVLAGLAAWGYYLPIRRGRK